MPVYEKGHVAIFEKIKSLERFLCHVSSELKVLKNIVANSAHNQSTNFSSSFSCQQKSVFVPKPPSIPKPKLVRKSVFVKPVSGKSDIGSKPTVFDLEKSSFYKNKTLRQRYKYIMKERLCFGCLQKGHVSVDCKNLKICEICHLNHPTSLHELSVKRSVTVEKPISVESDFENDSESLNDFVENESVDDIPQEDDTKSTICSKKRSWSSQTWQHHIDNPSNIVPDPDPDVPPWQSDPP